MVFRYIIELSCWNKEKATSDKITLIFEGEFYFYGILKRLHREGLVLTTSVNKDGSKLFKCFLLSFLLMFRFVSSVPTKKSSPKCIVCHKPCDKKLETAQKSLPQCHDFEACFGI